MFGAPLTLAGNPERMGYFSSSYEGLAASGVPAFDAAISSKYRMEWGFFTSQRLATVFNWGIELGGDQSQHITIGLQYYMIDNALFLPYARLSFYYLYDPITHIGYETSLGGEWNLKKLTGIDNLRVAVALGYSHLLSESPRAFVAFLPQIQLQWSY